MVTVNWPCYNQQIKEFEKANYKTINLNEFDKVVCHPLPLCKYDSIH